MPPILQELYASRGVFGPDGLVLQLGRLHSPGQLGSIDLAAQIIGDAIVAGKRICIAGDYDCDGATGTATAVRGLKLLGAKDVDFIVPNRFLHGYGLSVGLVDAMNPQPDLIVTVDSGVASVEGVAYAKSKGIAVVVTDHHLPGDQLPNADAIVNPNLKDDPFPSKALAGVGVMFYTLLKTQRYLAGLGMWPADKIPDLSVLLDIVALGTVADLVPLDYNNRILVKAGLERIRNGRACEGIKALITSAKRETKTFAASDIAFSIAPRLNAAGRLEDMRLGVLALLTDDPNEARERVEVLEKINAERRELQADMVADAEAMVAKAEAFDTVGVVVYEASWHHGIVGLVASKLKESLYRPVIALAPEEDGVHVRGSARSIPGFHLRDALALIDARFPGMIEKFGGHAMAAGLTLKAENLEKFRDVFDQVAREHLNEEQLSALVLTDGEIPPGMLSVRTAHFIRDMGPWGQAFPEPVFENVFYCRGVRVLGDKHLSLELVDPRDGDYVRAIYFNGYVPGEDPMDRYVRIAYELSVNVWNNTESLQLMVRYMEVLDGG